MSNELDTILNYLKSVANPENVKGMAKFGINPENTLGIPVPVLRGLAKQYRKNHALAQELWGSGYHEARLMAAFVDDFEQVTEAQMENWVRDFNSWDVCDQVCSNLFDRTPWAYQKALEWSRQEEEFVRRAGFVMVACLAVHDKKAPDEKFIQFLPAIVEQAGDERNFVKKAINWALRQIGKRNIYLHAQALGLASDLANADNKTTRWIGRDALRELTSEKVRNKISG
jgi:3-methyladenine DNA glycosylase AlkD